jgi:tRNA dimethylallyltransferase
MAQSLATTTGAVPVNGALSGSLDSSPRSVDDYQSRPASPTTDYTLGLYQAIGYKEFRAFLSHPTPSSQAGQKVFNEAVEAMKLSTRQYARRQVSWIRNKLLPATDAANAAGRKSGVMEVVPTYMLDATG